MGCNKNLTDNQLQAMFTATNEEMWELEQPIKCLTERTKCNRIFSNKAALNQHHCELQMKMRNAPSAVKLSIVFITWRST